MQLWAAVKKSSSRVIDRLVIILKLVIIENRPEINLRDGKTV